MTYELIRKRVKMLKESEAMGASLSPRDYELIGLLAEREALILAIQFSAPMTRNEIIARLRAKIGTDKLIKQIEGGE